jgi:hypothetical protein
MKIQLGKMAVTGFSGLVAVLTALCANTSYGSVVDLGDAAGFSVLTYNTSNTSDSAFQGGPIGVVNGDWKQSGGAQTNTQQPTQVILSPGHTNNGPNVETTVFNSSLLNSAWSDAQNASAMLAALTPTQTLGAITSGMTITEAAVGNYVFNISSINLSQAALTLSAPAGSTFVLNISGNITLSGGNQGNGLRIAGGLTTNDVVFNLTGVNSSLTTSGGGNAQQIDGIVLATGANASVNLHPGEINNEVIATTFTSSSGALVMVPPTVIPEANAGWAVLLVLLAILSFHSPRIFGRKRSGC